MEPLTDSAPIGHPHEPPWGPSNISQENSADLENARDDTPAFDLLITDGLVIDGTGRPGRVTDIGIREGRIVALGELKGRSARERIEARGLVVAPGFIDIHAHADVSLLLDPQDEPRLRQGVTTVVFSNCGLGFAPASETSLTLLKRAYAGVFGSWEVPRPWRSVREYLELFVGRTTVNIAYLVPHAAVRALVLGLERRAATEREIAEMADLVRQAMAEGAFGLSTGLAYAPMAFATREELRALLHAVGEGGGFFAIHLRDYFDGLDDALTEALILAEETGVPVQISHLQTAGRGNWGKAEAILEHLHRARERGVDVTFDSYPYTAGSTFLHALLPEWAQADDAERILARLHDPLIRRRIITELNLAPRDWASVTVNGLRTRRNAFALGRSLAEIARARGISVGEAIVQLLREEELQVSIISHHGYEPDVCRLLRDPFHMIGSDGIQTGQRPHPRLYGAFARFLGHYVRERGLLPLEEAVRKITALPAARLRLRDRGTVEVGKMADLVLFDPQTIGDRADYAHPRRFARGIEYVLIRGRIVKDRSGLTGAHPGLVLHPG